MIDFHRGFVDWVRVTVSTDAHQRWGGFIYMAALRMKENPGDELLFSRAVVKIRKFRAQLESEGSPQKEDPGFSPEIEAVIEKNRSLLEVMES